jgi:hypothetical protein
MSRKKPNRKKFNTGITLAPDVARYLNALVTELGWNRSMIIDFIVREHARQSGRPTGIVALDALSPPKEVASN